MGRPDFRCKVLNPEWQSNDVGSGRGNIGRAQIRKIATVPILTRREMAIRSARARRSVSLPPARCSLPGALFSLPSQRQ